MKLVVTVIIFLVFLIKLKIVVSSLNKLLLIQKSVFYTDFVSENNWIKYLKLNVASKG